MTVKEAYEKISLTLDGQIVALRELGLEVKKRIYYNDKNLFESAEFNQKCILIFGNIMVSLHDMEDEDASGYSIGAEIKAGDVSEAELDESIKGFIAELEALKERLDGAENVKDELLAISREQAAEIAEATAQFNKEIKAVRRKMLIGIGALILILVAVVIIGPLLGK